MSGLLAALLSDCFCSREFVESWSKKNDFSVMSVLVKMFYAKPLDL